MPIRLPPNAPTIISTRATDSASRIEISDAARASPIHSAEVSQIFSTNGHSPISLSNGADKGRAAGAIMEPMKNRPHSTESYRSSQAAGVISLDGRLSGDSIPLVAQIIERTLLGQPERSRQGVSARLCSRRFDRARPAPPPPSCLRLVDAHYRCRSSCRRGDRLCARRVEAFPRYTQRRSNAVWRDAAKGLGRLSDRRLRHAALAARTGGA